MINAVRSLTEDEGTGRSKGEQWNRGDFRILRLPHLIL